MRKHAFILSGGAVLVLLLAVLIFVFAKPSEPLNVSVVFASYTNDSNGVRLAAFTIGNGSRVNIRRWNYYYVEVPQQPFPAVRAALGQTVILAPGQRDVFTIPAPTNTQPWRVAVICSPYGIRLRFADWANRSGYWRYLPKSLTGAPGQYARSDWIEMLDP